MQVYITKRFFSILALSYVLFILSFFLFGTAKSYQKYPEFYLNVMKKARIIPLMAIFQGSKYLYGIRSIKVTVYREMDGVREFVKEYDSRRHLNFFHYFKN